MTIKFKNPPINEVAVGVYFENEIQEFRTEHVGLYWRRIEKEFPSCRQQPVIMPPVFEGLQPPIEFILPDEASHMPRYLFEAVDAVTLVQVQKNGFLFNWRKRDAEYPHFATVKEAFDKNYAIFMDFLGEVVGVRKVNIQIADLTYINIINANSGYWREPKDTQAVFPNFSLPGDPDVLSNFNLSTRFSIDPDLSLRVAIRNGKSPKDKAEPVLLFEMRALGVLGSVGKYEADEWFNRAHDVIGDCFLKITSPDIQERFWEKL